MQHGPSSQVAHRTIPANSRSSVPPHWTAPQATAHDAQALEPRQGIGQSGFQNRDSCGTQAGGDGTEEEEPDSDVEYSNIDVDGIVEIRPSA